MKLARQNPRIGAIVNVNISDDDDDDEPPMFLTRNLSRTLSLLNGKQKDQKTTS